MSVSYPDIEFISYIVQGKITVQVKGLMNVQGKTALQKQYSGQNAGQNQPVYNG